MTKSIFNRDIYIDPNGIDPNPFYFTRGSMFTSLEGMPSALLQAGLTDDGKIVLNMKKISDDQLVELMEWKKTNKIKNLTKENLAKILPKSILNYVVV